MAARVYSFIFQIPDPIADGAFDLWKWRQRDTDSILTILSALCILSFNQRLKSVSFMSIWKRFSHSSMVFQVVYFFHQSFCWQIDPMQRQSKNTWDIWHQDPALCLCRKCPWNMGSKEKFLKIKFLSSLRWLQVLNLWALWTFWTLWVVSISSWKKVWLDNFLNCQKLSCINYQWNAGDSH